MDEIWLWLERGEALLARNPPIEPLYRCVITGHKGRALAVAGRWAELKAASSEAVALAQTIQDIPRVHSRTLTD